MSAVSTVYRNVKGLKTAIKDVGRLREISLILAKHGFGAIVVQLGLYRDHRLSWCQCARLIRHPCLSGDSA